MIGKAIKISDAFNCIEDLNSSNVLMNLFTEYFWGRNVQGRRGKMIHFL